MYHKLDPKLEDREWLKTEYVDKARSPQSIADELGCNNTTVWRRLKKYGIGMRKRTSRYALLNDKDWLRKAYLEDGRSVASMAREAGCTFWPMRDALHALGFEIKGKKTIHEHTRNRLGSKAGHWKGGRRTLKSGYIYIYAPEHPYATKLGYVMEHRLLMEKRLGRYLEPGEIVHHINGVRGDNSDGNLELKENGTHISDHFKDSHEVGILRQRVAEIETLLKKYIEYIKDVEGTDYITIHDHRYMCEVKFTEEEWQELERLARLEPDGQNPAPQSLC